MCQTWVALEEFPNLLSPGETVYLASPYTHDDPMVRESRFLSAVDAAAYLVSRGVSVFAPIPHSHTLVNIAGAKDDWLTWRPVDIPIVRALSVFAILAIPGWEESVGVTDEYEVARMMSKPCFHLLPIGVNDELAL